MLSAVQRATHPKPENWNVSKMLVNDYIQAGSEMLPRETECILFGSTFKKGLEDQYHGKELAKEKIGLEDENFNEVAERVAKKMESK